jgi:two-component system, response regulator RegA
MSTGLSFLVVDDDDVFRERLSMALSRRGYDVSTAATVKQALAMAAIETPELAVVDLRMTDGLGLEVLSALKKADPNTQVVLLTGFGSMAVAVQAMRLGATHVLAKPVDADDVLNAFHSEHRHPPQDATPSLARAEWEHISRVLAECGQNVSEAARRLGIHRRSLQRKLQKPPFDLI